MATLKGKHDTIRIQLSADTVETGLGVLKGCTVAKAGVQALGKFVMIDKAGAITRDEKQCAKRIPVFTDTKFLDTLMSSAVAASANKKLKVREDHDDSIGARAGFADLFRRISDANGDRVAADIHLYQSYRNRGVVLEAATNNPEGIGLSIDFIPEFELEGDRALMRVKQLLAVDIVDEGAITPGGLFLSADVDTGAEEVSTQSATQPDPKMPASLDDVMSAMSALTKTVGDCMTAITKMATAPAPAADAEKDGMKAIKLEQEKLAADFKAAQERLNQVTADNAKLKKERAILGLSSKASPTELAKLEAGSAEDVEKFSASVKTYSQLVDQHVEKTKCKRSDAHAFIQKANPEAYRLSLRERGIYDHSKDKSLQLKAS